LPRRSDPGVRLLPLSLSRPLPNAPDADLLSQTLPPEFGPPRSLRCTGFDPPIFQRRHARLSRPRPSGLDGWFPSLCSFHGSASVTGFRLCLRLRRHTRARTWTRRSWVFPAPWSLLPGGWAGDQSSISAASFARTRLTSGITSPSGTMFLMPSRRSDIST